MTVLPKRGIIKLLSEKDVNTLPPINLLVKPASGQCNLHCEYCFYCDLTQKREQASYGMMTEETLDNMMRRVFSFAENDVTIAYQGGEPTLRGLDFFRLSVEPAKNTTPAICRCTTPCRQTARCSRASGRSFPRKPFSSGCFARRNEGNERRVPPDQGREKLLFRRPAWN